MENIFDFFVFVRTRLESLIKQLLKLRNEPKFLNERMREF